MNITDIEIVSEEIVEEESIENTELALEKEVQALANIASFEIQAEDDLKEAAEWLRKNKETQKIVKDHFEPERKKTHEAYKAVTDKIKRFTDILTKSERVVKKKMADYQMEQERARREAERRAEEERRKAEEERAAARARAEEAGEPEPENLPKVPEVLEKEPEEKIDGVSFVENWTFEIEDISKVPLEYLILDEKKVRGVVKAMKADTRIPGIRAYAEKVVRAR
jgi:hypothetical protein